jgi:hypothetical protein
VEFPHGDSVLAAGEVVSALARPDHEDRLRALFGGAA